MAGTREIGRAGEDDEGVFGFRRPMVYAWNLWVFAVMLLLIPFGQSNADYRKAQQLTVGEKMFFLRLKRALADDDRAWIVDHVSLPLNITIMGKRIRMNTRREILDKFELVFNKRVRDVVESQDVDYLFKNWRGVMVGHGEIWYLEVYPDGINGRERFYIVGINN